MQCVFTDLSYYDLLPEFLIEKDKNADSVKILVSSLMTSASNYNSFMFTLCVHTPTVLICYYLQALKMPEGEGVSLLLMV